MSDPISSLKDQFSRNAAHITTGCHITLSLSNFTKMSKECQFSSKWLTFMASYIRQICIYLRIGLAPRVYARKNSIFVYGRDRLKKFFSLP